MRYVKNFFLSVNAKAEQLANQFENHEAVAVNIIREVEDGAARVKVKLLQVQRNISKQRKELENAEEQEKLWIERTKKIQPVDEQRALECVKRVKELRKDIENRTLELKETETLEKQLAENQKTIEKKLKELRRKKESLSSRQSCTEAMQTLHSENSGTLTDIENLFSRWETSITRGEIRCDQNKPEVDDLADSFQKEEEKEELMETLHEIIGGEKNNNDKQLTEEANNE